MMGEFWQDNHHPVFRENAHLASEPSLTSHKAISLTLSHSSSWKSWKDKCLLCSFSVEETKEERDEASCSKSPGFTEEELGFVLPSKPNPWDCLGTQGHLKWTHSCLECMKVECLARRPHQSHHSDHQFQPEGWLGHLELVTSNTKMEVVADFLRVGSKITADGDCSHEIKGHLLFGMKAMTNPDSVLKSRDRTLLTKVRIVKAMVFLAVMYGCKSWTIKKVSTKELMPSNCGVGEDSWGSLG